ncbi:MAG: type II secretion system protein [Mariprofundales bacterium]
MKIVQKHTHMYKDTERGFTMLEMLVSVAIGLILLAGMTANFVAQSNINSMQSETTERLEDLHLASQIMQREMAFSQRALLTDQYTTATSIVLQYSPYSAPTACKKPTTIYRTYGQFIYKTLNTNSPTGRMEAIYWWRPGCSNKQELIRDLESTLETGMVLIIDPITGIAEVTLNSSYLNSNKQEKILTSTFKIWPRN